MMREIEYYLYKTKDKTAFPLINAVIEGLQDGIVFSDELHDHALFVLHKSGFSKLIYEDRIDFRALLFLIDESDKIPQYFHVYDADQTLIKFCEDRQDQLNIKVRKRLQLRFEKKEIKYSSQNDLAPFRIERISMQNFDKLFEFNIELDTKFWRSKMDFIKNGFGFCVFSDEGDPVSICYSACIANQTVEIDVATLPQFQNKGLASWVVNSFIEHCIENDIYVNWDCFEDNYGSLRTAKRIGFIQVAKYDFLSIYNKSKTYAKI
jgi:RimJ/RimL family protein N-acetyltransferase